MHVELNFGIRIIEMLLSKEGGDRINISQKLSDKYDEIKVIYESAASLVMLVRLKSLRHERIIKRIAKSSDKGRDNSLKEADILLNLRHPNIPILYDLEEDEDYFYLVEEYIVGESMADYLYLHQSISHRELIRIATELYNVLEYLHNFETPICYQDMKLEHIYLSKGRIVLIDYGIATYLRDKESPMYGTLSYVSEAQLRGKCDVSNDIISTKVALKKIYESSKEKRSLPIERLLKCDVNGTATEEKLRWLFLLADENKEKKHLDVNIAVVGNDKGIGVSHIAIAINCYLNNKGIESFYIDESAGDVIEKLSARDRSLNEKDNIIYHDCFKVLRRSGEALEEKIPPTGLMVIDCGTCIDKAKRSDIIIYVVSSRLYKSNEIDDVAFEKRTCVIVNPRSVWTGVEIAKMLSKKVYSFPIDEDPFAITQVKNQVLDRIISKIIPNSSD